MKRTSNRSHVISTASDLFLRKGLANTSMDEVVAQSKVSKSNIYYHFKSKEDLTAAVLDHRISLLQETLDAILQSGERSAAERVELVFSALANDLEGRSCVGGCPILSLLSAQIPEIRTRINRFLQDMQSLAERLLAQGVASGEFKADIPISRTAALLITVLEGAMLLAESHGNAAVLSDAGKTFLHLIRV